MSNNNDYATGNLIDFGYFLKNYKLIAIDLSKQTKLKDCVKIVVPLKYFSNFWRSLEMPLINCKVELSLKWYENCILSSAGTAATFAITDTKLYVPIVTLKTEDNAKLSKLLSEGFKRSVYWNKYQAILKDHVANKNIRERLDALFLLMCVVIMLLMKIHVEDIFFQGLRYRS